jgi:hypothetical protein
MGSKRPDGSAAQQNHKSASPHLALGSRDGTEA